MRDTELEREGPISRDGCEYPGCVGEPQVPSPGSGSDWRDAWRDSCDMKLLVREQRSTGSSKSCAVLEVFHRLGWWQFEHMQGFEVLTCLRAKPSTPSQTGSSSSSSHCDGRPSSSRSSHAFMQGSCTNLSKMSSSSSHSHMFSVGSLALEQQLTFFESFTSENSICFLGLWLSWTLCS